MKKILQLTKAIILTLAAVIMLLNTNVLTAYAGTMMFPGMTKTEDGRIQVTSGLTPLATDSTGRTWYINGNGYPYCVYKEEYTYVNKFGHTITSYNYYLDCYLTNYIETHDESEWPSFVVIGSDGIPFYYDNSQYAAYYSKFCYDKESGWWLEDRASKGPNSYDYTVEEAAQETKKAIENGEIINGTPVKPAPAGANVDLSASILDEVVDSDDVPVGVEVGKDKPEEPENPPKEDEENKDPYADVNTLGATVTLKTDCIKVKTNKKGVVAQKPLPKSVKVGKKALKKNKTFTVSYEKYTNEWKTVDAVTDEGIYRLVITGQNGYDGVYKKRLYVTADKTIKAMSSVSVKVNKMSYTGKAIESGVIKTAKIGKRTLVENDDYTVTYTNNTDSGTAQVTLTAKEGSGLLGTKTVNFTITGNKMSKVKVSGISSITYSPNVKMELDMSSVKLTYNGATLTKGTDFTVSYLNNTKAGTAKIVFTGKGLYNGTLTKTFKIDKAPLSDSMLDEASKNIKETYTGKAFKPEVTLKNSGITLKKGTDYTLTYKNNVKVSTDTTPAQITVKGKGNYTGTFTVNFSIIAKDNDNTGKSNAKNVKPDAEEPTEKKPVTDEPTEEEPVADDPTEDEPVADEPTEEEPVVDDPTEDEPVVYEPTKDEPTGDEPVIEKPAEGEPTTDDATEDKPVTDEPTADEPVVDEPTEGEPVIDEATGEEPVIEKPTEGESAIDDATEDEPVANEPTVDAPATEAYIIVDIDAGNASTVETTEQ